MSEFEIVFLLFRAASRAASFNKFARLAKDEALIGYVDKKRIYYNDAEDWVILGNNDDFFYCPITFRSITDDFKLRGVDIINATKMCAEYGIKWHLIIAKGKFYWIYCDIENDEVRKTLSVNFKLNKTQ